MESKRTIFAKDYIGQKFGMLTILSDAGDKNILLGELFLQFFVCVIVEKKKL
jgi:hypothetical protein